MAAYFKGEDMYLFLIYIVFVAVSYVVITEVIKNMAESFLTKYVNNENIEELKSNLNKSISLPLKSTVLLISMIPIVNILFIIAMVHYEDQLTDELYKKIFAKEN